MAESGQLLVPDGWTGKEVGMRIVSLVAGLILGKFVLDDAQVVNFLAGLVDTGEARAVAFLAYLFTVVTFAGAVLAIPAPRGSSIAYVVAGCLGIYLGSSTWWRDAIVWGIGAFILALVSYIGFRRQLRKATRVMETGLSA
jgi:hypothetical protein